MKYLKIFLSTLLFLNSVNLVHADVKGQALSKASEKISSTIGNLIPGEGVTGLFGAEPSVVVTFE